MFESALMESAGTLRTKSRWWTLASLAFYGVLLTAMLLVPLLNPQMLPRQLLPTLLIAPPPPAAPVNPPAGSHPASSGQSASMPSPPITLLPASDRQVRIARSGNDAAPVGMGTCVPGIDFGAKDNTVAFSFGAGNYPPPILQPRAHAPEAPIHVTSGIMEGRAVYRPEPAYPPIAKAAHIQGDVLLDVTISKSGAIENIRVVSGQPLLVTNAVSVVRSWRYRPYLLNGEPVEVEMRVMVRFTMS